jgi:hypothetical protein
MFCFTFVSSSCVPFQKEISYDILHNLVEKTKEVYVLPKLIDYIYVRIIFYLWMSKGAHDIFVLVIIFLGSHWQPKYVIIGLFEAIENIGQALVNNLAKLFNQYGLIKNYCICQWWGVKFECNNDYLGINCKTWSSRFGWKFSRYLFWPCFFKGLLICCKWLKGLQKS